MKVYRPTVEMLEKLNKVIQSCTSEAQLKSAKRYCNLFYYTLPGGSLMNLDQHFENEYLMRDLMNAIDNKRKEISK